MWALKWLCKRNRWCIFPSRQRWLKLRLPGMHLFECRNRTPGRTRVHHWFQIISKTAVTSTAYPCSCSWWWHLRICEYNISFIHSINPITNTMRTVGSTLARQLPDLQIERCQPSNRSRSSLNSTRLDSSRWGMWRPVTNCAQIIVPWALLDKDGLTGMWVGRYISIIIFYLRTLLGHWHPSHMQSSPAKGPASPSSDVGTDYQWPSNDLSPKSNSSASGSAQHPTTPLILVHEEEDDDEDRDTEHPLIMDFSSSDEDSDDLDGSLSPLHQINGKLSIPPLSPFTIFIYLLSPYLKLGALLLPYFQLPLRYGLSSLLISAILAVVTRHLLYLLARYLRKGDLEDVVASAFFSTRKHGKRRERRKERRREFLKFSVRLGTATLRILVAAVYLRGKWQRLFSPDGSFPKVFLIECVLFILPIVAPMTSLRQSSVEFSLTIAAIIIGSSLSYPGFLASRLVVYVTALSIFTYLLWLTTIMYLYTQGTLPVNPERLESRNIWGGISEYKSCPLVIAIWTSSSYSHHCVHFHLIQHTPLVCLDKRHYSTASFRHQHFVSLAN